MLGSSVHAALAEYHRAIQHDEPTSVDKLRRAFEECWSGRENQTRITFKDGETAKDTFDQGIALVEMYLKEPPPQRIVSIEQEIISPVHNSRGEYLETPLVAVADLITEVDEQLTVREIKTSSRAYSATETEASLQPTCYVNAVQEVFGFPANVEYTVLIKTKTPKLQRLTAERTHEDLGRLGDIVENIERAVQANIFYPVENALNCSTCPYRQPCRGWGRTPDHRGLVALGTNAAEES